MPLILNGSSLLKNASGGLATTTSCCCGQNPEECFCPDWCLYQIQVVQPPSSGFGAYPADFCEFNINEAGRVFPASTEICECGIVVNIMARDRYVLYNRQPLLPGIVGVILRSVGTDAIGDQIAVFVSVEAIIGCGADQLPVLEVRWVGRVWNRRTFSSPSEDSGNNGEVFARRIAHIPLPLDECKTQPQNAKCSESPPYKSRQIQAPVEVTITGENPGPQGWNVSATLEEFGDPAWSQECFDDCIANVPFTFRITRRPACVTVSCSCGESLNGLLANFESKRFTLGTPGSFVQTDGVTASEWFYTISGGQHIFERFVTDNSAPAGSPVQIKMATLYCEQDDSADPPADRWYVLFETWCYSYTDGVQTEQTKNAEIGYLLCYESQGCAGRDEGDFIPSGMAVEIEQLEDYPQTPEEFNECTPPLRAQLELFENCG